MKIHTELPRELSPGPAVSIDTEFFGQEERRLHRPHGTFACLSISDGSKTHQYYDIPTAKKALRTVGDKMWVMHNAQYDLTQLRGLGFVIPRRPVWDTMLVDRVLWNGYYETFALSDLARRYLDIKMEKEVRSTFADGEGILTHKQKQYAALDAKVTIQIYREQWRLLIPPLDKVYWEIDEPALWAVMDLKPVKVDAEFWSKLVEGFQEEATRIEHELGFNVMSPKQVKEVLSSMGFYLMDTKAETLASYAPRDPIFQEILTCRSYRKAVSTYGEGWLEKHVEEDGMVYPGWRVTGASTGRMSCANPNLMQIPARNEELGMDAYRKAFIPSDPKGSLLVSDVSQQEPRITAYMTKDENLLGAIEGGEDLHLFVTREIFHDKTITKDDPRRRLGKDINLGLTYGLTAYGLAARTGLTDEEAGRLLGEYFRRFPQVASWMSLQRNKAMNQGYVETAAGRRFYVNSYNPQGENNAINSPIQGGAADHTKRTLVLIWEECNRQNIEFPVCMVVHDELVLDLPPGKIRLYKKIITDAWMAAAGELFPGVPFKVDVAYGDSWACK